MGEKRIFGMDFFYVFLVFCLLFCLSFVAAEWVDCWQYDSMNGGTSTTCQAAGCRWVTSATDLWCPSSSTGCCMQRGCMEHDGNQTACENSGDEYNCSWDAYQMRWYPNGSFAFQGVCMQDFVDGGDWGGIVSGCWQKDGNKLSCTSDSSCEWSANDQNQEPWCWIKTLTDAQNKNPLATATDIGCCEQSGCWVHDNNETACLSSFQGNCFYVNNTYGGGWCNVKTCSEIINEGNCTYVKQNLFMPCEWNLTGTGLCEGMSGGGFGFYSNNSDSCFSAGGWYNSTGACIMPSGNGTGGGSGGFMFVGETHCWFADNKPSVCGNITGCAYCIAGNGSNGISNISVENICANKQLGFCEGHAFGSPLYSNADNSVNLNCSHIQSKSACDYGPLPNCKWANSTSTTGPYCEVGAKSEKKSAPPVQYCEDPLSKNNYTLCLQLSEQYMMPCKWQNVTYPIQNCTFNDKAVFGLEGDKDFSGINSEFSCTSAGGSWHTEYYVEGDILKQDSWCEMTGMFNIDQGQGMNNKMNCNTNCWACEFQNNGSAWSGAGGAESACRASTAVGGVAGGCVWTNNSNSFSGLGFCDYPKEMENGGASDCNMECEGCNFMGNPQVACESSMANNGLGCRWVNEGTNNYCVDKTKKVCANDCFSCFSVDSCQNSSLSCSWDSTFNLCSPDGFTGEVCFNGVDDDADSLIDCVDPDCGFDNFCGGSAFGGNCFAQVSEGTCNQTIAFENANCTWISDTWNPTGWCDMPGANCWKFNNDLVACGLTSGCTNESSLMGGNAWCEMNQTRMNNANCWANSNQSSCNLVINCQWVNDTWCQNNQNDTWCLQQIALNLTPGFCDYAPFASCMNLNATSCSANLNCSWREDNYSGAFFAGGFCSPLCMNPSWGQENCENATLNGLCEWRNMNATCQPETFMMMGASAGGGGLTGCGQYGGNQTGCLVNSITCTYKEDSYAMNNRSASEPSGWCMDKAEFEHFGSMDMGGGVVILGDDPNNPDDPGNPLDVLPEEGVDGAVDILRFGMRVSDSGFDFGAEMLDINLSIACNGYTIKGPIGVATPYVGSGNATGKYYWYLDTNSNESDGCVAVPSSGANLTGFDFLISYVVRNSSSGVVETKQLMRCANSIWNPTNALLTTSKKVSCGEIEGVMLAISKQDLESFSEYNKTAVIRMFVASANETDTRLSPSDSLGPGYYTPGTIDFGFVDCSNPSNAKNPKCKNFQKFGFNVYEECKNGVDDDENGLIDCSDPFCGFIPDCNGGVGFNFSVNSNDKTAPVVMFNDVKKLSDSAFIKVDTSEPSNLSLQFYLNDSNCLTINETLLDVGDGYQANANFKPFHSVDLMTDTLSYSLANGTTYYYKIKVCDPSGNCALSACSNFTTKSSVSDKSFIFKMDLPDGFTVDIPALNKTNYTFVEEFGGNFYDVGVKTNTSVTKNMNMTVRCGDLSLGFYGVNVLEPVNIDLSNAFICDEDENLIGMNSTGKKWNKLINDLHLGGATDYIKIDLPVAYSASNTLNWTDDSGSGGQDVDAYVNCSGNSSETNCKVPVSMGFSAYTITVPSAAAAVNDDDSGAGGAGGAGGVVSNNSADSDETTNKSSNDVLGDGVSGPGDGSSDGTNEGEGKGIGQFWVWLTSVLVLLAVAIGAAIYFGKRSSIK